MEAVRKAFKILHGNDAVPPGYQEISCHFIFTIKMESFTMKLSGEQQKGNEGSKILLDALKYLDKAFEVSGRFIPPLRKIMQKIIDEVIEVLTNNFNTVIENWSIKKKIDMCSGTLSSLELPETPFHPLTDSNR